MTTHTTTPATTPAKQRSSERDEMIRVLVDTDRWTIRAIARAMGVSHETARRAHLNRPERG